MYWSLCIEFSPWYNLVTSFTYRECINLHGSHIISTPSKLDHANVYCLTLHGIKQFQTFDEWHAARFRKISSATLRDQISKLLCQFIDTTLLRRKYIQNVIPNLLADGLAPLDARTSSGTAITNYGPVYTTTLLEPWASTAFIDCVRMILWLPTINAK